MSPSFADTIGMCGVDCALTSCYREGRCHGCRSDNPHQKRTSKWKCHIRSCVQDRKLSHCGECTAFPCPTRKNLDANYRKKYQIDLQENCRLLIKDGPEEWMSNSQEKYTCPACGECVDPYKRTCYGCGKPVD
ncbi:MAG: DUF3795 domain-containing protein [Methanomicrobiales archaeon]|nr:DUF3795 domain-containing protein [Methanomicrobiales archaeon]